MRASKARQVTATTCPLVDIQRSFCSRSASRYFVGNLPQKVKLVNGLTFDLSIHEDRVASEMRGVRAPVPARIATFSLARYAAPGRQAAELQCPKRTGRRRSRKSRRALQTGATRR